MLSRCLPIHYSFGRKLALCRLSVSYALLFFDSLGLTVNVWKSVLEPT